MMKILILTDEFATGGGAGQVAFLQAMEMAKGNEVTVLTAHGPENSPAGLRVIKKNLDYHPMFRTVLGIYHPRAIKVLEKFLQNNCFDVCYMHNINVNWSYRSLKILKDAGVKTILTIHDVTAVTPYVKLCNYNNYKYSWLRELRDAKWFYNPFRRPLVRKYISLAFEVRAVSRALADFLTTNGIRVDKVERNRLPQSQSAPSALYEDTIFFGGRLSTSKGALLAVEYLAKIREKYKLNPTLLVAGKPGIVTKKMTELAEKSGVSRQIKFLGWLSQTDYNTRLSTAGMVIVPSICFDSLPTMILEAMRAGRPVIATNLGGSRELVEEGITGFIADPKDIESFSGKIAAVLQDKNSARNLGRKAYGKFINEFAY